MKRVGMTADRGSYLIMQFNLQIVATKN